MKPSIGITPEHLTSISHALNAILADEFVLYASTRGSHWNVKGIDFYNKHLFFEKQYYFINFRSFLCKNNFNKFALVLIENKI